MKVEICGFLNQGHSGNVGSVGGMSFGRLPDDADGCIPCVGFQAPTDACAEFYVGNGPSPIGMKFDIDMAGVKAFYFPPVAYAV
jgi:hypothetical protein